MPTSFVFTGQKNVLRNHVWFFGNLNYLIFSLCYDKHVAVEKDNLTMKLIITDMYSCSNIRRGDFFIKNISYVYLFCTENYFITQYNENGTLYT